MLESTILLILTILTIYGCLDCSMDKSAAKLFSKSAGGRLKYYTNIVNYITIVAFAFTFIQNYIFKGRKIQSYFMSIALSLQFTLVTFYWGVIFFIPGSFTRGKIEGVSIFTDLCQHLFPFVGCLLTPFTICNCMVDFTLLIIGVGYSIYIHYLRIFYKEYTYPFLKKIGIFCIFFYLFLVIFPLLVFRALKMFKKSKIIDKKKVE